MMRHSDIRISSDIRIGCRIVEKNKAVTGQKRLATTGNGFSHLCGRYINCHGQSGGQKNSEMCLGAGVESEKGSQPSIGYPLSDQIAIQ